MIFPKKTFGLFAIAGLGYFTYNSYKDQLDTYLPKSTDLHEELLELQQQQKRLKSRLLSSEELRRARELFKKQKKDYWLPVVDGEPEAQIQSLIEQAARESDFSLNVVGQLRRSKVIEGITFMELNIAGSSSMTTIMAFLRQVSTMQPRFFWSRLVIRSTSIQAPDTLSLNGSLGFYYIADDNVGSFLSGGEFSL